MGESYFQILEENIRLKQELKNLQEVIKKQNSFNEYDIIKEQIDRSKIHRLNWNNIFNETLTKKVAGNYANGKTAEETYHILVEELKGMCITNPEILRRLKIGVCDRFGEIKSEHKKISEVKTEWKK